MKNLFIGLLLGALITMCLSNETEDYERVEQKASDPVITYDITEDFEYDAEPVDEYILAMDGYIA